MSLIHQVLQDLDQRNGMATNTSSGSMNFSTPENKASYRRWISGSLVIALACGGYWFISNSLATSNATIHHEAIDIAPTASLPDEPVRHDLSSKNLAAYIQGDDLTKEVKAIKSTVIAVEIPPLKTPVLVDVVATSAPIKTIDPANPVKAIETEAQIKVIAEPVIKPEVVGNIATINRDNTNKITREESHQSLYRQAVRFSSIGQFQQADEVLEQALAIEPRIAYLALKLRLFLEQKNADGFIQFYRQHNGTDSGEWLTVAAPGLHMLGFYQEAAAAYERLIHQQPSVVSWPMAMSLALTDAGERERAKLVLAWLPERYSLNPAQRQWVVQKAEALQ